MDFLPINKKDMKKRGWEQLDFILVSGDAYVDHPSFGVAIISRLLEKRGYKVGIIAQPDCNSNESFKVLGKPRLGFLVTSGNIDSMVNHYSVAKKRRQKDYYTPKGEMGVRPDRATIVYSKKLREIFSDVPIILGGIEASLRRLAHYDYWDNRVRRSIVLDSECDIAVFGMGERQIIEIAESLEAKIPVHEITFITGTVFKTKELERVYDYIMLPTFSEIKQSKRKFAESFAIQSKNTDAIIGKTLVEKYDNCFVVQNPPTKPLTIEEMDEVYGLAYMRTYHDIYEKDGGIAAIEEVKFSVTSARGCFGNCNFCALAFHQGRVIQARSHENIIAEAEKIIDDKNFKGYIHDVGGPTANFRAVSCEKQLEKGVCANKQCLFPAPCKNLTIDHSDYVSLLRKLRNLKKVKKVFIRSGIRYDYLIYDKKDEFFNELCEHHVSGQLKVAPEHISPKVLEKMGKPGRDVYERFTKKYHAINKKLGMNQFLVPYLMSSHPASDLEAAIELAEYLRDLGYTPEQVQDFYPTPGTLSTCMYYTELDPLTMEKVYVPKSPHEKAMQRALIQYKLPQNYELVLEALKKCHRNDLIGFDKNCLIRPRFIQNKSQKEKNVKETVGKNINKKTKTIRNLHKKINK